MKRFLFSLFLMALLPMMAFAEHVEATRAQKAAQTFLNNNGVKSAQLTDVAPAAGFSNLYIFNAYPGFVVMAADDCAKPILGYSFTDSFSDVDMPDNMRWWLQQYDDEIQQAIDGKAVATPEIAQQWNDLAVGRPGAAKANNVVDPLIDTRWNQGSPYNMYCPSGTVTGCVATAMAQVMKFWNYPEQGQGSHTNVNDTLQTVNFAETTYDWENMTNTYGSSSSQVQKEAVAMLMYHCGVSVDMNYGPSSGAVSSKVPSSLVEYFRYAPSAIYKTKESYTLDQWVALLKSELDESRPLFYAGNYMDNDGNTGGHAFVCDGYRSDDYFHFNWGWGGSRDGYFAIGALNPGGGNTGSGSGTYNLSNGAAFYVEPISDLTAPTLSAATANGAIVLSWNAIEEADAYDIYRDNVKIAAEVTENSYTDDDIASGVYYEYYVRAVAGETKSNPSNLVSRSCFFRDYTPSDLTLSVSDGDATLTWTAPENNSGTLQYATGPSGQRWGMGAGKDTYWTEVFAPSRLADYVGMYIEKVSAYLYLDGTYTLYIFEDNTNDEANKLFQQSITISSSGWYDIVLPSPVALDCAKELWIVMYYPYREGFSNTYNYPATSGDYSEIAFDNEEDEERFNPRLLGESLNQWYYAGSNISWVFRTYLTDGSYTYNLYRDGTNIASPLTETSFVDNDLSIGQHSYYVTTNYYAGESGASNTVSLELAHLDEGWNWWASDMAASVAEIEAFLSEPYQILSQNGPTTGDLGAGQFYKIQTPETIEFPLTGIVADLSSIEVPIGYGVNWFGCPGTASISLADLVITPAIGDKIISQNDGFAIYGPDGWSGTLTALQPQHGYVYVSEAQEAKILKFYTEMP